MGLRQDDKPTTAEFGHRGIGNPRTNFPRARCAVGGRKIISTMNERGNWPRGERGVIFGLVISVL